MPRFSAFWLTHYKEIGNCCMTAPLKKLKVRNNVKVEVPDKFQSLQLVIDYIDTGWMDQKQLKWIGWDIQGWYAWTDPNGMLYRIKDLQRNEDGREYEKEVEEIVASGDPRTHQGNPTAKELYTFERDMQRNCGFCPDGSGGGTDADHEGDKGSDTKKENIADDIDLDKLMQGDITDFMPGDDGLSYVPEMREYAPIIDTTEITETGHITGSMDDYTPTDDGQYIPQGIVEDVNAEYGGGKITETITPVPYLPPVAIPTAVPTPQPTPQRTTPVWRSPVTDTTTVATPAQSPFQEILKARVKLVPEYEWGGSNLPRPYKPGAVGVYNPTPTFPSLPKPDKEPIDCATLIQYAEMADDVYGEKHYLSKKWSDAANMIPERVQIILSKNAHTGLSVNLYFRTLSNGVKEFVFVFRGSELELNDWLNNIQQPFGKAEQYRLAAEIAQIMENRIKIENAQLVFVGHSLGGGLASLAALVTGRPATTFNAPGLSTTTIRNNGAYGKTARIDAYVVEDEILNYYLESVNLGATANLGSGVKKHVLSPKKPDLFDKIPPVTSKLPSHPAMIAFKGAGGYLRYRKHKMEEVLKLIKENCF
ncbi:MAG: DUF2974 domain-containing protein [Taibaiella sp.]|nr:DUF2974 domain-containing protein [Taibaiella sp.]